MLLFDALVTAREAGWTCVPVDEGRAVARVEGPVRLLEIGPQASAVDVLEAAKCAPGRGVLLRLDAERRVMAGPIRNGACARR